MRVSPKIIFATLSLLLLGACGNPLSKDAQTVLVKCGTNAAKNAFDQTLKPVLTQNCASCHGAGQAPLFALSTANMHQWVTVSIGQTKVMARAQDRHCGGGCAMTGIATNFADFKKMSEDLRANECQTHTTTTTTTTETETNTDTSTTQTTQPRTIVTNSVSISGLGGLAADGSPGPVGYLKFPLTSKPGLDNVVLVIEAQRYTAETVLLKRPRLYIPNSNPTAKQNIYIEDLRVHPSNMLNENRAWRYIATTVNSVPPATVSGTIPIVEYYAPVLSPIVPAPIPVTGSNDVIILSFNKIEFTTARTDKKPADFTSKVLGNASTANTLMNRCAGCHNSSHPRQFIISNANATEIAATKQRVFARVNFDTPSASPLIVNPTTGANGHPTQDAGGNSFSTLDTSAWIQWIIDNR